MRLVKSCVAVTVFAIMLGCGASGPRYHEIASSIPAVPPNKARLYFLSRSATPEINLNGKVVGKLERGSFFYVDEHPGKHTVFADPEKPLTFVLESGQTKYIRPTTSSGKVGFELITSDTARIEVDGLTYIGAPIAKK